MNRKKTVGLLVAAMGLSLALTGCGETTVQVEGLPQDFHAYEDNGDVNSTITIDNVDYTIEEEAAGYYCHDFWVLYLCK